MCFANIGIYKLIGLHKCICNSQLLLLSRFSHVRLCATPQTAAHRAPLSLGFSRQECRHAKSLQPCPTLCDIMDSSPPGSSVHGILQARILEWVAISFSGIWPHLTLNTSLQALSPNTTVYDITASTYDFGWTKLFSKYQCIWDNLIFVMNKQFNKLNCLSYGQ